jgi:hypothetical protein
MNTSPILISPTPQLAPSEQDVQVISPGWGFTDLFTGISDSAAAWREAWNAEKKGDKEGFFDQLSIAVQKPASAFNALTGLGVKIIEAGSFLHWFGDKTFIVPLSKAVSGLGIILCISEIFLETISLKRSLAFGSQFINSPAPEINVNSDKVTQEENSKKMIKWARKTQLIINQLQSKNPEDRLDEIQGKFEELITAIDKTHDTIELVKEINQKILTRDLNKLNDQITLALANPAEKAKLQRRLGVLFFNATTTVLNQVMPEINKKIDTQGKLLPDTGLIEDDEGNVLSEKTHQKPPPNRGLLLGKDETISLIDTSKKMIPDRGLTIGEKGNISSTELEGLTNTLEKAQKTLKKMHIQLKKRQTAYKIGILGATILLGGLAVGITFTVCPLIPIALVLIGTLLGIARFLYWAAYAESDGWENDLGNWAESKVVQIQEHILKPILELVPAPIALDPNSCNQEEIYSSINFGQRTVAEIQ